MIFISLSSLVLVLGIVKLQTGARLFVGCAECFIKLDAALRALTYSLRYGIYVYGYTYKGFERAVRKEVGA
jgi:hypothetical protein